MIGAKKQQLLWSLYRKKKNIIEKHNIIYYNYEKSLFFCFSLTRVWFISMGSHTVNNKRKRGSFE